MIDAGLFTLLSTTSAITALCGTRIYPVTFPTGPTYPAMAFKWIGAKPNPTLRNSGYQRWRMEFECRDHTYALALAMRGALRSTLEGYNGVLSDGTFLQDAQFVQLRDDFEDDPRVYCCTIEFYLFFNLSS